MKICSPFFLMNLVSVHCLIEWSRTSRIILNDSAIARHLRHVPDIDVDCLYYGQYSSCFLGTFERAASSTDNE